MGLSGAAQLVLAGADLDRAETLILLVTVLDEIAQLVDRLVVVAVPHRVSHGYPAIVHVNSRGRPVLVLLLLLLLQLLE